MFKQPLPTVMGHKFSMVPRADIPRSRFDRSHGYKTTFDAGYLYPVFVDEVLPGDTMSLKPTMLARMATPIFPIMDNLHLDTFFFFVPYRLLWTNWQRFCGERKPLTSSSIDYLMPVVTTPEGGWTEGSLADYFGIPTKVDDLENPNAMPFRAYSLIYNEWFRDQNLIPFTTNNATGIPVGDGPDNAANFVLQKRGKRHDYFTSCLPFPQKGEAVNLPLGTTAPVYPGEFGSPVAAPTFQIGVAGENAPLLATTGDSDRVRASLTGPATMNWDNPNLHVDLTEATAATINALREAFQIQKFLERDARGGTRYTEIVLSHFGVQSPDARLQRPEYLGGGSVPVGITPMAASAETAEADDSTLRNLGDLGGVGMAVSRSGAWNKSFTEHGVIIGLVSVRADLTYQQGLERMWSRRTRFDHYWPVFAHLGEQAVLNKEIYAQGTSADDQVFGYQERWAEYRYKPSRLTGLFRSNATASLDVWHLSQDFESLPGLNQAFIEENVPMDRVVAVDTQPDFILDCYFQYHCARPMPTYSVPGLIDHF